jgi:predicted ATP-dependent endonuclease of OLD family
MGIQAAAIIASFLWITEEEKKLDKKTIWLIEEPESYLHPQLADSCHKMLEKLRSEALLVTTTHSLGFVHQDPKKVVGTSIDKECTKVTTFETYHQATSSIRDALGVRFSDFYNLGLLNVFVEGKTDREIFQWFLSLTKDQNEFEYPHVRAAVFCDYSGVNGIEGFMKATYEFIYKERPVITILDGDTAGDKCRRNLQQYFGQKGITFQPNIDYISLPLGFAVEGLFPHDWIIDLYEEHPNWFHDCSYDLKMNLQPFTMKNEKTKEQLRNNLIRRAEEQEDLTWAADLKMLFDTLEAQLSKKHEKTYGNQLQAPPKPIQQAVLRSKSLAKELVEEPKETSLP